MGGDRDGLDGLTHYNLLRFEVKALSDCERVMERKKD